jgi:hypothetical protein
MNFRSDGPEGQARIAAFIQALQKLGWNESANVRTDVRWAGDDAERYRKYSEELVALNPDVILASASPSVAALQGVTRSVPIVFANVVDPVGAGYVTSLARPGGNTAGFTAFEYSIGGKWLELLKQIAPRVTRVAVIRDPAIAAGIGQFAAIQSAASSSAVELSVIDPRNASELERALDTFASEPNGGVIVTAAASNTGHRELLNTLATRHRLPINVTAGAEGPACAQFFDSIWPQPQSRNAGNRCVVLGASTETVRPVSYNRMHSAWAPFTNSDPPLFSYPNTPDTRLFPWGFCLFGVSVLEGELGPRTERYEPGRTRRKDFFHQPCFCFRPHHKNLCQHRDHLLDQNSRTAMRVG